MKKLAVLLLALLLLTLPACSKKTDTDDPYLMCYGDPDAKDALHILVDFRVDDEIEKTALHNFAFSLQETGGLENLVFERLPQTGAERTTRIQRLRTEIMAGSGPDVFILAAGGWGTGEEFIPYPEKVMENGLFLTLDTYMENNSQFTNWDDQQQVVLAAGRTEEGQQIIPLSYTFPVQVYKQADLIVDTPDTLLTWNDTLTDPKWKDLYASVNDLRLEALVYDLDGSAEWELFSYPFLEYAVGRIADYKAEELLVTEEELKERIEEVLTLREESPLTHEIGETPYREYMMSEDVSNKNYNVPITILPMYSDDGGVTVSVNNYAAINRNTKHPEKAYTVIDLLMREYTQLEFSYLFSLINDGGYIPLNNKALHPDHPMRGHYYLDKSSLKELTDIKEQITAVNFYTDLSTDINSLLYKCEDAWERNEPIDGIVHEVYVQMQRKLRE